MIGGQVLVTGAEGYLGNAVARRFLEAGREVVLWFRASGEDELRAKEARLRASLGKLGRRAVCAAGDLTDEAPFERVDPRRIERIIHAAAATSFAVDGETADSVNVAGAAKLLAFAARCPRLGRVALLSTLYSSGLTSGTIEEAPLHARPEFANHYERSKWEAEALLRGPLGALPWTIARVATVVADDETGAVGQQNAVHNTLKLLYYGLLSIVPGKPDTPLYFVTRQFVVDAIYALASGDGGGVIHVSHGRTEALRLGEVVDLVYETFLRDESFRRRRILKPIFADEEAFRLLVEGTRAFAGGVVSQAVESLAPFARQLYVAKAIADRKLLELVPEARLPESRELLRRTCEQLVGVRFRSAA